MADNYLITGYCGKNHVTAECDRGIQAGIVGAGRYVLPVGKQFKAENVGNNTIRIYDGKLVDNGAAAGIPAGEYIDLIIPNASQGMNRNDLIVFQYSQDHSTLIETGSFVVVRGTETSGTAVDPKLQQEDLLSGMATFDQMALWRIPVSTGTISAPVQLFKVSKSLDKAGSGSIVVDAFSSDGISYTATVEDLEELYNGFAITIIPNITSATTAPTLNVNGLGAKPIRLSLSQSNSLTCQAASENYYAEKRPIQLMFDSNWLSTGMWRVTNKQRPSAVDLYGTTPVTSGGTGLDEITKGNFIVGNGEEAMQEMTPEEVSDHICALKFVKLWENASPNSSFYEQGISVPSLSNYFVFAIVTNNGTFLLSTTTTGEQMIMYTSLDIDDNSIKVHRRKVIAGTNVLTIGANYKENLQDSNGYDTEAQLYLIPYGIYGVVSKGVVE